MINLAFVNEAWVIYPVLAWLGWIAISKYKAYSALGNIPGPPSNSFWTGVTFQFSNPNGWAYHKELEEKYGSVVRLKALLGENQLLVYDPKALHQMFTKDQHIFEETPGFIEANKMAFGPGLLGTLGETHRKQRKMLNPVFSTVHMREMVPIFYSVVYQLRNTLQKKVQDGSAEIDLLHWMTRSALELIGQSGLGYSFDTLEEDSVPHPYSVAVKKLGPAAFKIFLINRYLLSTLVKIGTPKFRRAIVDMIPWKAVKNLREIIDEMHSTSVGIIESKRKALEKGDEAVAAQVGQGKDVLSILLRANMDASKEDRLPEDQLLGQISTFLFAATDTTSGALSRIFHLLALNPDIQERLRTEITEARKDYGGDLPYDELVALPYLDAILRETLRLYPPLPRVLRSAREDAVLSLSNPIKGVDGREMREIHIPKGTGIHAGIMACNRNVELWGPDAHEWRPERWLEPLPDTVTAARIPGVYSNLMTFIGGGKACIGFKFSQMEMKVVLSLLLESFRFSPSEKEVSWRMGGIVMPATTEGGINKSQLPIVIELVK